MTKASGRSTKDIYQASGTFTGLWLNPEAGPGGIYIVGLDVPEEFCPDLADPDRLAPDEKFPGLVESVLANGVKVTVEVRLVKGVLKGETVQLVCAVDGRQRILAAREANKKLRAAKSDSLIRVPCKSGEGQLLDSLVIMNEHRREDTTLAKARKAQRMRERGSSEQEIRTAFGITESAAASWKALLQCTPKILDQVEAGKIPVAVGFQIGREAPEKQEALLAKVKEETGGKLTGQQGRNVARDIRKGRKPQVERAGSAKMSASSVRALWEAFGPIPAKGPGGKEEFNSDTDELCHRLLGVILGEDPTAKKLAEWPDIQKIVRKVIRSASAE